MLRVTCRMLAVLFAASACAAAPPTMQLPFDLPAAIGDAIGADAARRGGVPREQLQIVSARAVTWSDGAMGCPMPGMAYTQALVPGWRIELQAPGQAALLYHASRRGGWLWCPRERAQPPLPAAADPSI